MFLFAFVIPFAIAPITTVNIAFALLITPPTASPLITPNRVNPVAPQPEKTSHGPVKVVMAVNTPERPLSIQKLSKKYRYSIPVNNHGMNIFSGVLTRLK
jgi:hypothetical protein